MRNSMMASPTHRDLHRRKLAKREAYQTDEAGKVSSIRPFLSSREIARVAINASSAIPGKNLGIDIPVKTERIAIQ